MTKKKLKTYVVYEVWTRHYLMEAESINAALEAAEPKREMPPGDGGVSLNLSNWHAVAVPPR